LRLCGSHEKAAGEIFIIADKWKITWRELFELFCRELKVKPPRLSVPAPIAFAAGFMNETAARLFGWGEPKLTRYRVSVPAADSYFSSEKARRLLGYSEKVDLEEAVKRTALWYRSLS
jgi:nucleoside-diphosphate-sugar epimerase